MTHASFPSEQFPGLPAVHVDVPEGWQPRAIQDTYAAWINVDGTENFGSNLVLSITRVAAQRNLNEAAASIEAATNQLDQVEVINSINVPLEGREWHIKEYAFVHPQVGTLIQVMAITTLSAGDFTDTVQFTASVAPVNQERDLDAVREAIKHATVEPFKA